MKAKRFLALIALLLCASMLFVSCKKEEEAPEVVEDTITLSDIFNMSWSRPAPEGSLPTQNVKVDLKMSSEYTRDNLIIYKDVENSDITRIYDYVAQKELVSFTDSMTAQEDAKVTLADSEESITTTVYTFVNNYVYVPSGKNIVVLTVTHKALSDYVESYKTTYLDYFEASVYNYIYDDAVEEFSTTYDLKIYSVADLTNPVKTVSDTVFKSWLYSYDFSDLFYSNVVKALPRSASSLSSYTNVADDLIVAEGKLYRVDSDNYITLVRDIGMTDVTGNYKKGEKYYYDFNSSSSGLTVYDAYLNPISSYSLPSYVSYSQMECFILNDGNVLLQCTVEEDEAGDKYDFMYTYSGRNYKYSLYTYVVSAADGKATEVDVNYVVYELYAATNPDPDYANYYNSEISNIASVYYFADGRLNDSKNAVDIVSMDNNANIVKSLKMYDAWAAIPFNLGNGLFSVKTVYDTNMIMDANGNILTSAFYDDNTNYLNEYTYDYTITTTGIYDAAGRSVYDLTDKSYDLDILDYDRNIVLVKILTDNGTYKLDLINNGSVTTIASMDATGENDEATELIDTYSITYFGFYTVTYGTEKDVYNYYSANGTLLITTDYQLSHEASYNGVYLYYGYSTPEGEADNEVEASLVYYRFS